MRGQRSKVRRSTRYRRLGVRVLLFAAKNLILVAKIAVTRSPTPSISRRAPRQPRSIITAPFSAPDVL
jgi:hypothetical protein